MTGITVALYMFVAGIVCEFSSNQLLRMGKANVYITSLLAGLLWPLFIAWALIWRIERE
ncbi:TPA: hypothetical protein ACJFUB_004233 [Yersinia enterocolitica]|uniref:hypothetical protein n=1 Tax=Yersinia TaxID=629 RepID=UPI0005E278DF|nr:MULTISPECIES: hypothetical protein [Yersinia]EKN3337263.1 hypothetical protein [Yersinia enterocolitica]ELW8170994.1 hypothetical protein [Yersinia enterocolitica]ELY5205680.1 hypothetical protein [Yersinia enterocolitica]UYJ86149.1 hypothetical protein N4W04_05410 [Yersinia enterocolitica]UYK15531.1 hypothetical protein N4224_05425 [Yersinia enterocolitica]